VPDKNMKQLETSIETYEVYLEMFDTCAIISSGNINANLKFFPRTPQL
jgi:hypothetical protein